VVKEAEALAAVGNNVEVLGSGVSPEYRERDARLVKGRKWKFTDLMAGQSAYGKLMQRTKRFLGYQAHRLLGWENRWQLGPMAEALLKEGRKRRADLYIAHSEAGMWAAEQLRREGKRVGVDMEDWFSEDLLPEARKSRPIQLLKTLEKNLLCHGAYSSCTSEAMADALVKEYGCRRPTVIRNVFPIKDREGLDGRWKDRPGMAKWMQKNDPTMERPKEAPISIHWFSQTIGPGRGLEILFQALDGMEGNWELHLRGNLKGYEGWLKEVCPNGARQRLTVHGLVENEELLSRIAEHDIGYAGELKEPPSRDLTITNKLFQYLQAGLAVVASDTTGQKEVAKEAQGAICHFQTGHFIRLKEQFENLLRSPHVLCQAKQAAWGRAGNLCWEKEKQRIHA
jgi:glycosyltransferase involved in cell wall biosynthesis